MSPTELEVKKPKPQTDLREVAQDIAEREADARHRAEGPVAGSSLMSGAFIAKRFMLRLEPEIFRLVMDGIVLAAG